MRRKNPVRFLTSGVFYCLLFVFGQASNIAGADQATPFYTRDQNPLVMIYGLPTPTAARLIDSGQSRLHTSLNMSNTLVGESSDNETLFVDIETYQFNLLYDYGLSQQWMFRLQLPMIRHSGGFMDDWIDRYHQMLGLPQDIRPFYPSDEIHIRYRNNNSTLLSLQQSTSGIGDLSLQLAYQASSSANSSSSYWLSLKLPSGDSEKLTGSGATDLALWLAVDARLKDEMWAYANAGAVFMGDSDILPQQHHNTALFATVGMQFHPWRPVQLKFQFDSHSAFYDSSMKLLGHVIQLTFGGSIIFDKTSSLDIAIAEDIQTRASPDVNFNLSWHQLF